MGAFGPLNRNAIDAVTWDEGEFGATNCVITVSHSQVVRSPRPAGYGLLVHRCGWIRADTHRGLSQTTHCFSVGRGASGASTDGGQSVILNGTAFGRSDATLDDVYYVYGALLCPDLLDGRSAFQRALHFGRRGGDSLRWGITVAGQTSLLSSW